MTIKRSIVILVAASFMLCGLDAQARKKKRKRKKRNKATVAAPVTPAAVTPPAPSTPPASAASSGYRPAAELPACTRTLVIPEGACGPGRISSSEYQRLVKVALAGLASLNDRRKTVASVLGCAAGVSLSEAQVTAALTEMSALLCSSNKTGRRFVVACGPSSGSASWTSSKPHSSSPSSGFTGSIKLKQERIRTGTSARDKRLMVDDVLHELVHALVSYLSKKYPAATLDRRAGDGKCRLSAGLRDSVQAFCTVPLSRSRMEVLTGRYKVEYRPKGDCGAGKDPYTRRIDKTCNPEGLFRNELVARYIAYRVGGTSSACKATYCRFFGEGGEFRTPSLTSLKACWDRHTSVK